MQQRDEEADDDSNRTADDAKCPRVRKHTHVLYLCSYEQGVSIIVCGERGEGFEAGNGLLHAPLYNKPVRSSEDIAQIERDILNAEQVRKHPG